MSEFPDGNVVTSESPPPTSHVIIGNGGGDMTSLDLHGKKAALLNRFNSNGGSVSASEATTNKQISAAAAAANQQLVTSSSSSATSSSSRSVSSKRSQLMHHSLSTSEMKNETSSFSAASASENFSRSTSVAAAASTNNAAAAKMAVQKRGFSVDHLPLSCAAAAAANGNGNSSGDLREMAANELAKQDGVSEMKFEQQRVTAASKMKMVTDQFSAEKSAATNQELKRVQAGNMSYEEKSAASAMKERLETDQFTAEKMAALKQERRQLKTGDTTQQESRSAAAAAMKFNSENFSAEKRAMATQEERQTVSAGQGVTHAEKHVATASSSKLTITAKGICTKGAGSSAIKTGNHQLPEGMLGSFPDLQSICYNGGSSPEATPEHGGDLQTRFTRVMSDCVGQLRDHSHRDESRASKILESMNEMLDRAWSIPAHGNELGDSLCRAFKSEGGLDILINNCASSNSDLQLSSARLLGRCMTSENRDYVVENGLDQVVNLALHCSTQMQTDVDRARIGTEILEQLFKHSEGTCSDVMKMGGLDAILSDCKGTDVETLRHCAAALANLSLYGGSENQQAMIRRNVPVWLFPLAFHSDAHVKYYACLAIAALVANKEIEAAVLQSGTLNLVEPFVSTHSPAEFAQSSPLLSQGQTTNWLRRLVPVLTSKREEARSLAAFHFAMEAGIKKAQGNVEVFREIGAIGPLKQVASSPNAIASKLAAQALRLMGEEVPHKLSQQVPLWTVEDVKEWVSQIGFSTHQAEFVKSRVDGDLLLQLTEEMLREDIGIRNGILRKRFMRELNKLKRIADYSSCDSTRLNATLQSVGGEELSVYTYRMLQNGVDSDVLRYLGDDQLLNDCGIENSIHRLRLQDSVRKILSGNVGSLMESEEKNLDVFISYRRSNGSQLASLLKVHLTLRGFSVFLDVERLEAGKFDNNLLQSIRQARHFILVLTPLALDRCSQDEECKDWVHREIVAALQSQCNIIPIIDNFQWPEAESLPEDMRAICYFNGVRWIHDYQEACVDKLERFMRGEMNVRTDGPLGRYVSHGAGTPGTPSTAAIMGRGGPLFQRSQSNESKGSSHNSDSTAPVATAIVNHQ